MRKLREGHKVSIRLFTMAIMSSLLLVLGALPTIVSQRSPLLYSKQRGAIAAIIQNGTVHTGNVFFVMTGGSDTIGQGQHPHAPFATVDFAIGQCTANQGDVIYVMPGYTETITNSSRWTVDVAGISIIGLGHGTTKPTITLATDTSADILVSAANVVIKNFRFVTTIDSLVNFWDLNAANFLGEDCDFVGDSSAQALGFINIATTIDDFATPSSCLLASWRGRRASAWLLWQIQFCARLCSIRLTLPVPRSRRYGPRNQGRSASRPGTHLC